MSGGRLRLTGVCGSYGPEACGAAGRQAEALPEGGQLRRRGSEMAGGDESTR